MKCQPYKENGRQIRNAEHGSNSLPQGSTRLLVIQYQMIIPENIQTDNSFQIERMILRNP